LVVPNPPTAALATLGRHSVQQRHGESSNNEGPLGPPQPIILVRRKKVSSPLDVGKQRPYNDLQRRWGSGRSQPTEAFG
jgi:hypothetical protein